MAAISGHAEQPAPSALMNSMLHERSAAARFERLRHQREQFVLLRARPPSR